MCNSKKWFCSRNYKFWEGLAQLILEYFIRLNFLAFNAPLSHGTRPRKQFNSRRPIIRPETKARTLNFILHPWHHPPPPRIIPLMNVPQTRWRTKCLNTPKCLNVFVTRRNYCTIVGGDLAPNSGYNKFYFSFIYIYIQMYTTIHETRLLLYRVQREFLNIPSSCKYYTTWIEQRCTIQYNYYQ